MCNFKCNLLLYFIATLQIPKEFKKILFDVFPYYTNQLTMCNDVSDDNNSNSIIRRYL